MTLPKNTVAFLCLVSALGAPALAGPVYENDSGGTFTFYGQFNPAFSSVDDGVETNENFADSAVSNSRVGLRIMQPYGANTFRFRLETAFGFPQTSEYDQNGLSEGGGWERTDLRHADFSLEGDWGRVSAGQGSMVADGVAEISLATVGAVLYQFTADGNGLYQFRDSTDALSGITVGDVFDNFDGSRRGRVRYDTPDFNGFSAGVAWGRDILTEGADDDDFIDIGVFYETEFGIAEFEGGLAYQYRDREAGGETESVIGSAGIVLDNGVGFAVGLGSQDDSRDGQSDPSWYYVQATYDAEFLEIGTTSFGVDYYEGEDFDSDGSESQAWGIGVLQEIDDYNVQVYLTYREHSFEDDVEDYQDITSFLFGARWQF